MKMCLMFLEELLAREMFELLNDFLIGSLSFFIKEARTPLIHFINPGLQENDLPDELTIVQAS